MEVKIQALFCDDARRDEFGTYVLTGVYPGLMSVEPGTESKVVSNWIQITGLEPKAYKLRLRVLFSHDEAEHIVASAETDLVPPEEAGTTVLTPGGLRVPTDMDGILKLMATLDEDKEIEIARVIVSTESFLETIEANQMTPTSG